jgi:hypothetical protein
MKSSHCFEVFIFGRTWMKARVEAKESFYKTNGSKTTFVQFQVYRLRIEHRLSLQQLPFKSSIGK